MNAIDNRGLLSPSDIAEIANVSRAAVSNWRRRDENFPEPVAGTSAKPLFDRKAIEDWLVASNKKLVQDRGESAAWAAMNTLRDELSVDDAAKLILSIACVRKLTTNAPDVDVTWKDIVASAPMHDARYLINDMEHSETGRDLIFLPEGISDRALEHIVQAVDTVDLQHLGDIADFILKRLARAQVKSGADYGFVGSRTSELLANLAISRSDRHVIYDPACGHAVALVAAARTGASTSRLVGSDVSRSALQIARQRAFLYDVAIELTLANILTHDPMPDLKADVVIIEPPFGMRMNNAHRITDSRFEFGTPPASASETAWIQHAVAHLTESGRAYVLTPHGPLFRGGQEQAIRKELVRRGCIEAIVGLPPRMLPQTSIPLALWVLRRPMTHSEPGSILFIDASNEESPETNLASWLASASDRPSGAFAEVSFTDVLAENGLLTPNTWVRQEEVDPDSIIEAFANGWSQTRDALQSAKGAEDALQSLPKLSSSRMQSVDDLMQEGLTEMRAGRSTARYEDLPEELRARVVTAGDVRDGSLPEFEHLEDAAANELPDLTQPGDVLVTTMHTIRARVDETGGHLPGTGVYRLRVMNPDVVSPGYLAVTLTGRWNAHLMAGSTIQRAPIRDLEIPLLPIGEQEAFVQAISATQRIMEQSDRLISGAEQMREALLDSARLGITLDPEVE